MDPTVAALSASAITGVLTFAAGFATALVRSKADREKNRREMALSMAKEMYDRQFWFAENQPNAVHALKSFDYFYAYYMLFSEGFPSDVDKTKEITDFLDKMSEVEPVISGWLDRNTAAKS